MSTIRKMALDFYHGWIINQILFVTLQSNRKHLNRNMKFLLFSILSIFMLFHSPQLGAKELTVVFDATKVRFAQLESGALQIDSAGVRINATYNANYYSNRNEYRWYQDQVWSFSSPYSIKKIIFSKEGVKENKGVTCEKIKVVDGDRRTSLTYGGQNPNYTATWTNKTEVHAIEFENISNAVWLGKITVILEGEEPVIDGMSTEISNMNAIKSFDGYRLLNVTLQRKFIADGGWYTLCVPFYRTIKQMKAAFGDEVEVYEFKSAVRQSDNSVQLVFGPYSGEYPIVNGKPYLIKPSKDTGDEIVFNRVNIHNVTPEIVEHEGIRFVGTYDPMAFPTSDGNTYAFLYGNDGLSLATDDGSGGKIKGTRAYFILPNGALTVGSIVLSETDGIGKTNINKGSDSYKEIYYTLTGLRIQGKPTTPGVYIYAGHKIVVH